MKRLITLVAIAMTLTLVNLSAQSLTTTSYSIGVPTGDLGDYISNVSGRGITFDYRKLVQPNVGVGFYVGWNVFYAEKPYDTYTLNNQSISGKQFRYTNSAPFMFATDYYLKPGNDFNPFIGAALGGVYTQRATDMGLYRWEEDAFSFGVTPQIGFYYKIKTFAALSVAAKYNVVTKAGDFDAGQNYLSINIGYLFMGN